MSIGIKKSRSETSADENPVVPRIGKALAVSAQCEQIINELTSIDADLRFTDASDSDAGEQDGEFLYFHGTGKTAGAICKIIDEEGLYHFHLAGEPLEEIKGEGEDSTRYYVSFSAAQTALRRTVIIKLLRQRLGF